MKGNLLFILSSFRRRKRQYVFISITLFLSALLLSLASALIKVADKPFDENFHKLKASHLLLFMDAEIDNYDQIHAWFSKENGVAEVSNPVPFSFYSGSITANEKQIKITAYLTEYIPQKNQDSLIVISPMAAEVPGYNEIWLPYHFKVNHGLELGDTLQFKLGSGSQDLVIAAFVVDPHFLSGLFQPTRIFMAPGAMAIYLPLEELGNVQVGVKLHKSLYVKNVQSRFQSEFDFSGTILEYQLFKSAFTSVFLIFSTVLLIVAIIVFLIVIIILSGTLSSQIYSDFRDIGILKTLGYTPGCIRFTYLTIIILIMMVVLPLGLFFADLSLWIIVDYMNSSTGLNFEANGAKGPLFLTTFFMFAFVLLITFFSTYKAGNVSVLNAIKKGKDQGVKWTRLKWYPVGSSEAMMGLYFLMGKPFSSLILAGSFAVISFLILFVSSVGYSLGQIKSLRTAWGFMDADVQISIKRDVYLPLDKAGFMHGFTPFMEKTEKVIPYSYSNLLLFDEYIVKTIRGNIYDLDLEQSGFNNLSGRHPKRKGEISLGIGTARSFDVEVGDSVDVHFEGIRMQMMVCGIYQDISTLGHGYRLHVSTMEKINPLFEADQFAVKLIDSENVDIFKDRIGTYFGEKVTCEESIDQRQAFQAIVGNVRVAILVLSFFFILIISILVVNDLNIHIQRDGLIIARLKAIGFTSFQVKMAFLLKSALIMLAGIGIGIGLFLTGGNLLISTMTIGMGMPEFPLSFSLSGLIFSLAIILIFGLLSSWNAMRIIPKISPTQSNAFGT